MSGADLGLSFAPHSGLAPAEIGRLAAEAEGAGFDDIFVAEGHGDALASCHPVIAATARATVGTAVANAALRPPVLAAKTAALLDDVSGGRFRLGLGTGNAFMNSRFGVGTPPSLQMMSEYVQVVRARAGRQPGRVHRWPLPDRPRAAGPPARPRGPAHPAGGHRAQDAGAGRTDRRRGT